VVMQYGRHPDRAISMGTSSTTEDQIQEFLQSSEVVAKFNPSSYNLLRNNCNNFSDMFVKFLRGDEKGIPANIINMPNTVMQSPMGRMILGPVLQGLENTNPFNSEEISNNGEGGVSWEDQNGIIREDLDRKYGRKLVDFFAERPLAADQTISCIVDNFLYIASNKAMSAWATSKDSDIEFSHIICLSPDDPDIRSAQETGKLDKIEFMKIDAKSSSPSDMFDVVESYVESVTESSTNPTLLLCCANGANESVAACVSYFLQNSTSASEIEESKSLRSALFYIKSRRKPAYPDLKFLRSLMLIEQQCLGTQSLSEEALEDLHYDSERNKLYGTTVNPVENIMSLGLPGVTEESARQALAKAGGDMNAAINLLI